MLSLLVRDSQLGWPHFRLLNITSSTSFYMTGHLPHLDKLEIKQPFLHTFQKFEVRTSSVEWRV